MVPGIYQGIVSYGDDPVIGHPPAVAERAELLQIDVGEPGAAGGDLLGKGVQI